MASRNQTPDNRCMPLHEWPAQDQAAWVAALTPASFLEPGGVAADWAEGGRVMVISGYGRWLTWLERTGQLDRACRAEDRVTRERVAAYARALEERNATMTVQARVHQLGRAMNALAPELDWRWLFRASNRIREEAVPVREKHGRMQSTRDLEALGVSLMQRAEQTDDHFATQRARLFRDGLIIATLALRPLRTRTFGGIEIGKHLVRRGDAWWLVFSAADTKTKQPEETLFPAHLVPSLDTYLTVYRPILLQRSAAPGQLPPTALWAAPGKAKMSLAAITAQIARHTREAFGKPINPHLFRDCAATTIAIEAPAMIGDVTALLSHASHRMGEAHYNQAGTLEAGRRHQAHVRQARQQVPAQDG